MDGKERYPEFRSLMNMLESRMTADGISLSVGEDLREAREKLQEAKRALFQNEIIFNELHEIMLEFHDKRNKENASADELKAYEMLQEAIRNADAKRYLKLSWTEDNPKRGNLFGLTEEKLDYKRSKKINIQQILQQYFVPDIEQRLKEKCIKLIKLWDGKTEGESDGLSLAKAAKLPLLVENEVKKISDGRSKLKLEERKHRKLLVDYQKVIKDYMKNLEEFIEKYPVDSQIDKTKTTAEWLEAKCEALQLKIKVLHCQLLKDTYDEEAVAALGKIRDMLEKAMTDSNAELVKLEQSMKIYESVGSGFDSLVKEYARLTAEIDNRKWALAELERTQKMEGKT